jgi:MFS transporter, FHS family, Na+ dependent glucose transporter 1
MRLVVAIALFYFTFVGAELGYGWWVFTYATKLGLADESGARLMTSVYWGALTIGRLITIPIAARFSPKSILAVDLAGCVASALMIMLFPSSTTILWVGSFGLGFAMASMFPTGLNFAREMMPITGKITSWFLIGASLGSMFLPWMIGQFFETVGPAAMLYLILGDLALGIAVFGVILTLSRKPRQPEPVIATEIAEIIHT